MNWMTTAAGPRAWAVMLLIGACALALGSSAAGATQAQDVTPERVSAAVARLDGLATETMERTGIPGMAIAVVYRDQVVYLKGFGLREAGRPETVDADTVFQLASLSKPVASTVMAALAGEGVIEWDDRVIDHDPDFQMYDPWVTSQVTLRDMFAHRSGLPDHAGDLLEDIGYNRAQVLHRLRYQKPASSLRSKYEYTNFGLTEAGVAGAKAAGKSWEDLSAEKLYRPLGMNSTSSRHADLVAAANRARGHVLVEGQWVAKYDRDADPQSPAGGVSSTARDLSQWLRLQLGDGRIDGKQVIAAGEIGETHRPQVISGYAANPATDHTSLYGLGWNVGYDNAGRVRLGHSGAFSLGAGTTVNLLPAEQLAIVILTNAAANGAAETVALSFLDLATTGQLDRDWLSLVTPRFEALNAPTYGAATNYYKTPPAQPLAALPASAYIGTYTNDLYGDIEIVAAGSGLTLRLGPNKMPFPLQHWDRDVFLYQPTGENADGLSGVTFQVGAGQTATSVMIEILDKHGQGTFTRKAAP